MSVKNWYPKGLNSTEQSKGTSNLCLIRSTTKVQLAVHELRREERFGQSKVFRVAMLSEDGPCSLSSSLDEDGVEKKKSRFSQAILIESITVISPNHDLNAFQLLQLQGSIKTFTLSGFE